MPIRSKLVDVHVDDEGVGRGERNGSLTSRSAWRGGDERMGSSFNERERGGRDSWEVGGADNSYQPISNDEAMSLVKQSAVAFPLQQCTACGFHHSHPSSTAALSSGAFFSFLTRGLQ